MADRTDLSWALILAMQSGGTARQAVIEMPIPLGADLGPLADALAAVATGPAGWRTEAEERAWLYCPDRQSSHILDGDPAVEHARTHGTAGELTPCPSCPGPALIRKAAGCA